jgi:hypothetical protein
MSVGQQVNEDKFVRDLLLSKCDNDPSRIVREWVTVHTQGVRFPSKEFLLIVVRGNSFYELPARIVRHSYLTLLPTADSGDVNSSSMTLASVRSSVSPVNQL